MQNKQVSNCNYIIKSNDLKDVVPPLTIIKMWNKLNTHDIRIELTMKSNQLAQDQRRPVL